MAASSWNHDLGFALADQRIDLRLEWVYRVEPGVNSIGLLWGDTSIYPIPYKESCGFQAWGLVTIDKDDGRSICWGKPLTQFTT